MNPYSEREKRPRAAWMAIHPSRRLDGAALGRTRRGGVSSPGLDQVRGGS